jgi:hypothetical protein
MGTNSVEPTLPVCPAPGTEETEIFGGASYFTLCLPPALEP